MGQVCTLQQSQTLPSEINKYHYNNYNKFFINKKVCIYKIKCFINFGCSTPPPVEEMGCDEVCCQIAL